MTPEKETKERILEAAFDLFSKKGYDRVSLNEIIEAANVSKGGLFHHFDSKYALGRDCLIWWVENHMTQGFMGEEVQDMEPEEVLEHFIDSMIDFMMKDSSLTKFFWSIFDEAMKNKEDHATWIGFLQGYVSFVESSYRRMGVKDPRMKAMIFLSCMDGITLYYSMLKESGNDMDLKLLRAELIRTYVTLEEERK